MTTRGLAITVLLALLLARHTNLSSQTYSHACRQQFTLFVCKSNSWKTQRSQLLFPSIMLTSFFLFNDKCVFAHVCFTLLHNRTHSAHSHAHTGTNTQAQSLFRGVITRRRCRILLQRKADLKLPPPTSSVQRALAVFSPPQKIPENLRNGVTKDRIDEGEGKEIALQGEGEGLDQNQ